MKSKYSTMKHFFSPDMKQLFDSLIQIKILEPALEGLPFYFKSQYRIGETSYPTFIFHVTTCIQTEDIKIKDLVYQHINLLR